jgi:hypothetical protein
MNSFGFPLQYIAVRDLHKSLFPTESYFLVQSKSIYDAEQEQNWFYNMTQDQRAPSLDEKRR